MKKAPLFLSAVLVLLSLMAAQVFLPQREMSELENRKLQAAPVFSFSAFVNGDFSDRAEQYVSDQSPLRDQFAALNALMDTAQGKALRNGVIAGRDGFLFDRTDGWSGRNVKMNAAGFDALAEKTGLPAYLMLVPSAGSVYPEKLPAFSPLADEEALLQSAAGAHFISLSLLPVLRAHKGGEPLYFRTDHHWTLSGAALGYREICRALSLSPCALAPDVRSDNFFGSFFARSPSPLIRGDTLLFPNPSGITLRIDGREKPMLYDPEKLHTRDAYAALLYGNYGLIELYNASAPGGTLLVVKDSYANLLLPTLSRHFTRVVAVDARYFTGDIVETVKESEAETLLCLFGLNTFSQSRNVALLRGL